METEIEAEAENEIEAVTETAIETEIINLSKLGKEEFASAIQRAAAIIKSGNLVAMPTETVYGLAADGLNETAVERLYHTKGRPENKAFSLQVADVGQVDRIAAEVPEMAKKLFKAFCPGPITIILKKKPEIPAVVTGGKSTVGIRIPDNPIALSLLKAVGTPLAVPSANISGHISPTSAQAVYADMHGLIPLILDGGPCTVGIESTIVDCTGQAPVIIRQGAISYKAIIEAAESKQHNRQYKL